MKEKLVTKKIAEEFDFQTIIAVEEETNRGIKFSTIEDQAI